MKLNTKQYILNTDSQPITINKIDKDSTGGQKSEIKKMTVFDVLSIVLDNTENSKDLDFLSKLMTIQKIMIDSKLKNKDFINLNSSIEINFLRELIINDSQLSNLIKGFVLSMMDNNGNF